MLITGAGSGIGLASSLEAARLGFSVVAAVHREDQLDGVRRAARGAGVDVEVEVLDVTDEDRARDIVDRTWPWALVNNAGYPNAGALDDLPIEEARRQLDAMVLAPVRLAQLALPHMRRAGGGRIVNVSSIAGEANVPLLGWYQATKSALSTLSDVLRQELAHHGVEVVVVEPGIIRTPIWDHVRHELRERRTRALEPRVYDRAVETVDRVVEDASDVAVAAQTVGAVLRAGHPRYRYRVGAGATVLPLVDRVVPTSVKDRVTRAVGGL